MHEFKVYFVNVKEFLTIRAASYGEAERAAYEKEKFHEISRILRDDDPSFKESK